MKPTLPQAKPSARRNPLRESAKESSTYPKKKTIPKPRKDSLFQKNKAELRDISCFDCSASHEVSPISTSTLCPKCGSYISLKSYEIRGEWNRKIQTRGDVFIFKKGIVSGTTIQCHHLTVEGDFTGGVECSGDLIIRHHGKIVGKVICKRLIIEKRATVEFLNSVETTECTIDGLVTGNITCSGRLALEKKAILSGNIKVGRLAISKGAKHQGQIQMGGL
ncbi:MAG: bactofilin family protein [Akkermansiaceae bacterium]